LNSSPVERARPVMSLARRRPPKISERVARDLAAYIVDSGLPPDTSLPTEKEMAEQLGVGRTTLREALRLLESRGVVTIRSGPRGGPVVRKPDPSDLADAVTLMLQFDEATLSEVVEARIELEATAVRLAATRIKDAQIEELRKINHEMALKVGDHDASFELNRQFHRVLSKSTGNVALWLMINALLAIYDEALRGHTFPEETRKTAVEDHDRIIEALVARDPDATEAALRRHVEAGWESRRRKYRDLVSKRVRWEV
jgi:DNA-binding FadR family transcriptional regulator